MILDKVYKKPIFVPILFLIVYLAFPTLNSSNDAWGYAEYVKHGENLFLSHHLLYNAIGFLWVRLINLFINVDTLKLLTTLNALFAAATLYVLGKTLKQLDVEGKRRIAWVALVGCSWAFMRYATDNETYIMPLFFSLLGSYFFLKSTKDTKSKNIFYSGFFSAFACLVHQIMFFWWFSILVGIMARRRLKPMLIYALPALLVPTTYLLVLFLYYHQPLTVEAVLKFIFRDYYSGAAGISTGLGSLTLFFISLFRSFFQVHGYIANLFHFSWFFVGGLISVILIIWAVVSFWQIRWDWKKVKDRALWVHLLAILLQLTFALLSSGNAEFMVMIPLLVVLVLSHLIQNEYRFVGLLASAMLIWNLSFGLIPLRFYELDNSNALVSKVLTSQKEKNQQYYVLFNRPRIENEVKYFTGSYPTNIVSGARYGSISNLTVGINVAIENGIPVLTDCYNRPKTISRETLVFSNDGAELFRGFNLIKVDSIQTLSGKYYLYSMSKK